MPRDHPVERGQQFVVRRIFVGVAKPPGWMVLQFLPTFVPFVVREPKRLRISDVNRDWHAQVAAAFPDPVQLRIVNPDELARAVAQVKAQPLVFLEPRRAQPMSFLDLSSRTLGEIRLVPACVVQVHVMHKAAGEKFVGEFFVPLELGAFACLMRRSPAAQVDLNADSGAVHDSDCSRQMFRRVINVLMQINDAMLRAPGVGAATHGGDLSGLRRCAEENGRANHQTAAGDS